MNQDFSHINQEFQSAGENNSDAFLPYKGEYAEDLIRKIINLLPNAENFIFERRFAFKGEEENFTEHVETTMQTHPNKTYLGYISIEGSTGKNRHAVSLIINPKNETLIYQDPLGNEISDSLRQSFEQHFPNYSIKDMAIKQQMDAVNCAVITADNLVRIAQGQDINPSPDIQSLRDKHSRILPPPEPEPPPAPKTERTSRLKIRMN